MAYSDRNDDYVDQGVLYPNDVQYPQNLNLILKNNAPKELSFIGNLSLLEKKGVGFCGSRKAGEKGIDTAIDCAEQVAKNDAVVISGYAAGVDLAAHYAALKVGGPTIIVLPEGIDHFRIKKELKDVWDWSKVLVLSQFKPNEIWQSFRAMTRNQVIIALSKAMIVIEAQEKGGTIEAGKSTLKLKMPLFVAEYEDMTSSPGNNLLVDMGALKLKKSRAEGKAKLTKLFETISNFSYKHALPQNNQMNLI